MPAVPRVSCRKLIPTPTPNTTPAKAGAQLGDVADDGLRTVTAASQLGPGLRRGGGPNYCFFRFLFSREGGSPDWTPAFAGEQGWLKTTPSQ